MEKENNRQNRRNHVTVFLGLVIFLAFVVVYFQGRETVSLNFPAPFVDEGYFLYPALSFQETGSFFAPELNPDRPILWMPPGYMVAMGTAFKLFGFSLYKARLLSALALVAAFGLLLALAGKGKAWLPVSIVLGFGLLSRYMLFMGNLARMEPMMLMLCAGGFVFLARHRLYQGIALLLIALLVHPNAVYFVFAGGIAWFIARNKETPLFPQPKIVDLVSLGVTGLALAAYGIYVIAHWNWFSHDMVWQANLRARNLASQSLPVKFIGSVAILYLVAFWGAWRLNRKRLWILAYGLAAFALFPLGANFIYQPLSALGMILLAVGYVLLTADVLEKAVTNDALVRWSQMFISAVIVGVLWLNNSAELPFSYPPPMQWSGYDTTRNMEYFPERQQEALVGFFLDQYSKGVREAYYFPFGEALLLRPNLPTDFRFRLPVMHERRPSLQVVRISKAMPSWQFINIDKELKTAEIDPFDPAYVLFDEGAQGRVYVSGRR